MTKRILAWVLALALVFSLMPLVSAETEAPGMSQWHDHTTHEGWTAWSGTTGLPTTAGKYYLTADVTLTKEWTVPSGETHLCLNGHHITQTGSTARVLGVNAGRILSIYDCAKAYEGETYVGGTISGGKSSVGAGIWIARGGGVFNLYGGRITGNAHATAADGGAVYLQSGKTVDGSKKDGGVFNMYGGEIVGNGTPSVTTGSAVYLHGESSATRGGKPATFNMYGGKIAENTGKQGAVCGAHDAFINIQGGEICDNVNSSSGGAIYTQQDMVLTVANATITGNKATNASGIYAQNNVQITIENTTITGNTTTSTSDEGWGAAVYMTGTTSKVTLVGDVTIANNTIPNSKIADLYINSSSGADIEKVYVQNLTGNVKFGIHDKAASVTEASQVVAFADPAKTAYGNGTLRYWTGTESRFVGLEGGTFRFVDGHFHGSTFFSPWNDSTKLPSSGTYYLNTDVTLATYESKASVKNGNSLTLCMNGHTIDNRGNIAVQETFRVEKGNLHLVDCTTTYDADGYFTSGGKVTGGKKAGNGAVIYANNADSVILVEGVAFLGNECTETNQGYGGAVLQVRKNTTPARFVGCLFSENISAGGGTIAIRENGAVSLETCVLTKNRAVTGAAVQNVAGTVEIKDCKITENVTTGTQYGAVNLAGGTGKITGKTNLSGNLDQSGAQKNLYLVKGSAVSCDVSGLTAGAQVGVSLHADRIAEGQLYFSTAMTENPGFCVSDDAAYTVELVEGKLALVENVIIPDHAHKLCGDAECADHSDQIFEKWSDTTTLPSSGSYYLENDVVLSKAVTVSGNLVLCLNGKTITQSGKDRVFSLAMDSKLTITDCQQAYGQIVGGVNDTGAAFFVQEGAVLNLYAGKLTGSKPASGDKASSGAAIFLRSANKGGATFNMYGGEITGNGNNKSWGGAITNGSGNANNQIYVNIYGGKIYGNTAATGGAIRLERKAVLTITGGEIYENTATTGGAVYLSGGAPELKLQGGKLMNNTAETGAGIYVHADAKVAVSGAPTVMDNTASGKQNNLYLDGKAKLTLGAVEKSAKLGVTAASVARAISSTTDSDYTENFVGDSSKNPVTYKDQALWIDFYSDHQHTACDGVKHEDCDHSVEMWLAWESATSLPTASGYYYLTGDVVLTGPQTIGFKQQVYLCLNGKTVTAAENNRHLLVESGAKLTITDCSQQAGGFTGGNMEYGSAINMAAGSTLHLFAGKFYDNASPNNGGGAIYMRATNATATGGTFNMYGGEITDNTSVGNGAAIVMNPGTKLNIYGGKIAGNQAVGNGGGIFATGNDTLITMYGGVISGNTARNGGGLITQSNSAFVMNGGTISGNKVTAGGGGAYISIGTSFTMNGGTIKDNSANNGGGFNALRSQVTLNGGSVTGNTATTSAGAFRSEGATVVLNKVTISGNTSKDGGTAYIVRVSSGSGDTLQYYPSNVTVNEGALITGNKGTSNSGGFLIANEGVVVTINGGEFSNNTAANGGALMTWRGSTLIINGGKISGNRTTDNGGGIYVSSGSTFKMNGGTITGNKAKNAGGIYILRAEAELAGGTISNNAAAPKITVKDGKETKDGGNAGGVYICGSKVNMKGTSLIGNSAEVNGGGMVMSFSTAKENGVNVRCNVLLNIYGGTISGNTAKGSAGGMLIQSEGTVVNMYGGTFRENTAKNAGAIYVSTKTVFHMSGGAVYHNKATASAGAIYVLNATANITGGQLYNNVAVTQAGLLACSGATTVVRMKDLKIHGNSAKTYGAIFIQGKATFYGENCDFYDNIAEQGDTGALSIGTQCKGELTNCKFYNNSAATHAGAFIAGQFAQVTMTDCDFTENQTGKLGGAIYVNPASQVTITDTAFRKNVAGEGGGAVLCRGNLTLVGCTVEENSSAANGGAFYGDINAANGSGVMRGLVLENTEVRGNTAGGKGGAFYMYMGCRLELWDSKVTGNSAALEGGAIWSREDTELHNTKITGNASGGEGFAVYMDDADYDGHSYSSSKNKLSGSVIIQENMGGDLWMGPDVFFAVGGEGMGQDTHIEVTLDSGKVTNRILGSYHYEGGDQVYTVTCGDRSLTEPEYDETLDRFQEASEKAAMNMDLWLYVGIGALVLALATAVVLVLKKKKAGKTAEKAGKE